ncbi:unnamed protein product [Pylaiella littoralis]
MLSPLTTIACSLLAVMPSALGAPLLRRLATDNDTEPAWTYRDQGTPGEEPYGPSEWYLGYPDCALERQCPINLSADIMTPADYSDFSLEFTANTCDSTEMTFQADFAVWQVYFDGCAEPPYVTWDGTVYNLLQVHIHSPSEHLIGGAERDAGMHLVHVSEAGELLVVGVIYDVTVEGHNVALEPIWNVLGLGEETTTESFTTSIYGILPESPSYSHFLGSLTTPPCSQGVKWIVMNEVSTMGEGQLQAYRDAVASYPGSKVSEFGDTNRPVQPVNDRNVIFVS